MSFKGYEVIETPIGPVVSESRTTIYDILLQQQEGESLYAICGIYNLRPLQVQVAFEYIEQHRERLEAELPALLEQKAERERYHRAIAEERKKLVDKLPMTPERIAFYALRDKNRSRWQLEGDSQNGQVPDTE